MNDDTVLVGVEFSEYPFARKGMTVKEFDEEVRYMAEHYDDWKKGNYTPLWKQRENNRR